MMGYKYTFAKFCKDWALVFSMIAGVAAYLIYREIPAIHHLGGAAESVIHILQPILLFSMLFLSFCKIEPHQMRPHKWMIWLLLFQSLWFILLALLLLFVPALPFRIGFESAMLCLICPTAAACAVITGKLGGNMAGVMTYTILINIITAVLVPLFTPLLHPIDGLSFHSAFAKILAKVFPMLIMPCICAWIVRYIFPKLHQKLLQWTELSFYLWIVSLSLAILMSTRAMLHNDAGPVVIVEIAVASLFACALQFWFGKKIGRRYRCNISAGQALGQKNTVFAIWMGYTFMTPVVSVAGGLYSIWQNCFNSYQLYKKRLRKGCVGE